MLTADKLDAHCKRSGCACDHVVCYRGWIDTSEPTSPTTVRDVTSPCHNCRPHLHERWLKAMTAKNQHGYPAEAVHRILRGDVAK